MRGEDWKIFWKNEADGLARENIEAWCPACFGNNFEPPRETLALLVLDIAGYDQLLDEAYRTAVTLKAVLRDAAEKAAQECQGRVVLDRRDDDVLVEFPTPREAVEGAQLLRSGFHTLTDRLDLQTPALCGAIHCGEVTRWRSGVLAGEAVDVLSGVRRLAAAGQIVLTEPAITNAGTVEAQALPEDTRAAVPVDGRLWAMQLR